MMEINELKLKKLKKKLDYKTEILEINEDIRQETRKENKKFVKKYRKLFWVLDIAFVLLILMNLGALLITNALVFKLEPEESLPRIVEANPVVAKIDGFQQSSSGFNPINQMIRVMMVWVILISVYLYRRTHIYEIWKLNVLVFYVLFIFLFLGVDFINNLGFLIGKMVFN